MAPLRVGVMGCGTISPQYLGRLPKYGAVEVVACADIDLARAESRAAEFGVPKACSPREMLHDSDIELIVNLTVPKIHAEVSLAAIAAGKHIYSEKPLAVEREDGGAIMRTARENGVIAGCAPDTFLGGGIQTCRKLIDDGAIGRPIAATAFIMSRGHEHWHADPDFFYQRGGGPMFDMGPYYLTALICLTGPVRRVSGSHGSAFKSRTIQSEPRRGETIDVEVSTHVAGVMDFESGAIGTIITSFDVWASRLPRIEVYGTEGTLSVPDPNGFGGPVRVQRGKNDWKETPLVYPEGGRGLGVAEMAGALRNGRPSRVEGSLANHVLDIMHAFHESSDKGRHIELGTTCERPAAVPAGLEEGVFDDA